MDNQQFNEIESSSPDEDIRKERLKERLKKKKKEDRVFTVIFLGIPILVIGALVVWLISHFGGIIGIIIAIICLIAFIPEIFNKR